MLLKKIKIIVFFFFVFTQINNVYSTQYSLIKSESFLKTKATYLIFFSLIGEFKDFEGEIIWDKNNLKESSFSGYAKIDELTTGYSQIDDQLHSSHFFDKERYPSLKILSTDIEYIEENKYIVHANLTVKDVTISISEVLWVNEHPENPEILLFKSSFFINRHSFNLANNLSSVVINDRVLVSFLFSTKKS